MSPLVRNMTNVPGVTGHLSGPGHAERRYDEAARRDQRPGRPRQVWRRYVQRNKRALHLLLGVLEVDRPADRRHGV